MVSCDDIMRTRRSNTNDDLLVVQANVTLDPLFEVGHICARSTQCTYVACVLCRSDGSLAMVS